MVNREQDAARKREERARTSTVFIPDCADRDRRKRLEADDEAWLAYYFGPGCELDDPFTYQFTEQQIEMIKSISRALEFGLDQSLAASRGEGKSIIVERLLIKYTLEGRVDFSVLMQSTGPLAEGSLDSIKNSLEKNVLLEADYPEVCIPVQAVADAPQKAGSIKVSGKRHDDGKPYERASAKFTWSGQEIIFPNVPGSPSARSIIATRGLEAAVRGFRKRGKRPKIVVIDDPDTEETAASETQAKKLEKRIDAALGALGGQKRRCGRVMITTLQSRISASFIYTDPMQKPSFNGRRFRFLIEKSDRQDLCDEYIEMRKEDQQPGQNGPGDPFARRAHAFYLQHQAEIERTVKVSNPNRFDSTILPDGTQTEVSAFQFYLNEIARTSKETVATEFDNDPPLDVTTIETGLEPRRIQTKVNNLERRIVPSGTLYLTQGIDARKVALHWVIRAWLADGTGHTIDYGVHELRGVTYGSDEGVDVAIRRAIIERIMATRETKYVSEEDDDKRFDVDLTLIDARWRTQAVMGACMELGAGVMPVMGFGKSAGCVATSFSDAQRATPDKTPGDGWFLSRKGQSVVVCTDADRWKRWEHDRWATPVGTPGCMYIFGFESEHPDRLSPDEKGHHSYSRHICNEKEMERPYKGGVRRQWIAKSDNTHWLDASCYSDVAANMRGFKLDTEASTITKAPSIEKIERIAGVKRPRRSLHEMAKQARMQ
jgi:hypothetical protein